MQLIHKITGQICDIELVHEFLAAVEDAEHWVENKIEEFLSTDTSAADMGLPGTAMSTDQSTALETADIPVLSTYQIASLPTEQADTLKPAAVEAPADAALAAEAAEHPAEGL